MMEPREPPVPLKREKEQVVKALIDQYAADNLTVEEFESRLDSAYAANTQAEREGLLAGLPVLVATGEAPSVPAGRRAPAGSIRQRGYQIAILGAYERKGAWTPPRKMRSLALMSSAGLDFREAKMPPGVTEVSVLPIMGHVEILVPPGMAVETRGFGLLGSFEGVDQEGVDTDPDAPRLVIKGVAIMGAVEVSVRLPGETARDARRRHRELRRKRHKQLEGGS